MTEVELAVADAADWLDRTEPGWADRVDVGSLNMDSARHCVLGQIFHGRNGDYYSGFSYGYYVAGGLDVNNRHRLTGVFSRNQTRQAWVNAITARTVQAVVVEPQPVRDEERELVAV